MSTRFSAALPPASVSADEQARFAFGDNWRRFLEHLDPSRIDAARTQLRLMLDREDLSGLRFLDAGSGSGLMSLAAHQLGAEVHSFDYDDDSVRCTQEVERRHRSGDQPWVIERGDALDRDYLARLGQFDVVYSWGVLHHTGDLWSAAENIHRCVTPAGQLFIAIYNDAGLESRLWARIKRAYVEHGWLTRRFLLATALIRFWGLTIVADGVRRLDPLRTWRANRARGMSAWYDLVDWVGGHPYEFARPEQVFDFYRQRGFQLERLITDGGIGCNQFVFRHLPAAVDAT